MNAIKELEREQLRTDVPEIAPGDTVRVHVRVVEGVQQAMDHIAHYGSAHSDSSLSTSNARKSTKRSESSGFMPPLLSVHERDDPPRHPPAACR